MNIYQGRNNLQVSYNLEPSLAYTKFESWDWDIWQRMQVHVITQYIAYILASECYTKIPADHSRKNNLFGSNNACNCIPETYNYAIENCAPLIWFDTCTFFIISANVYNFSQLLILKDW